MSAAYRTAVETNPDARVVLIRSPIHGSTRTRGLYRPDRPHITVASKDDKQRQDKTHEASHGYTASLQSTTVVEVKPSGVVKPDSTLDMNGNEIWPSGLDEEEITHNG